MKKHYRLDSQPTCSYSSFLLTTLTVAIWFAGCVVIGYISWVMATSVSVSRFVSGTMVFTYVMVVLGFLMFFTGFLGCIGVTSRSNCLIKLYILVGVMCIAIQVGGLLTFTIMKLRMSDVLSNGWREVNQATRNIFQSKFDCCGYEGPKEFAYRNDVLDASCYTVPTTVFSIRTTDNATFWVTRNITGNETQLQLKQEGCESKLSRWVDDHRYIWIPSIVGIGLIELLSVIISAYIVSSSKTESRSQDSSQAILPEETT